MLQKAQTAHKYWSGLILAPLGFLGHCTDISNLCMPQACLLPTVHAAARSSPSKRCAFTQPSTWCKRKWFIRPGYLLLLLHASVLMLTFPLWVLLLVDKGQHIHPDWSVAILLHMQQKSDALCLTLHLSEPALTCLVIWATAACLLDQNTQASLCSSRASVSLGCPKPCYWLPLTTFDRFWPLQTKNTPQELQFWRCSDTVLQPTHFSCF